MMDFDNLDFNFQLKSKLINIIYLVPEFSHISTKENIQNIEENIQKYL